MSNSEQDDVFLKTASQIAAKLCRDAIWAGERCNWLGASMEFVDQMHRPVIRAMGPEIYSGTSGIGLFLARAYHLTGQRVFGLTARGAAEHALSRMKQLPAQASVSFYSGALGIAASLLEIGETLQDEKYIATALSIARSSAQSPVDDRMIDVIQGSASGIPLLLHFYQRENDAIFLEAASRHATSMLNQAQRSDIGWAWSTMPSTEVEHPLCGYAHGASGIALALLELFTITGDEGMRHAADEALRYEDYWFDDERGNYPDFRKPSQTMMMPQQNQRSYMMAWCHGAPGAGTARVRAYELTGDERYRHQAEKTIASTSNQLQQTIHIEGSNYSLCHGMGGNAALLIYAAQVFDDPSYKSAADIVGNAGIEQYPKKRLPWACGVQQAGETPSLMLGTAGIGCFYLGLHNPAYLPPILPPRITVTQRSAAA